MGMRTPSEDVSDKRPRRKGRPKVTKNRSHGRRKQRAIKPVGTALKASNHARQSTDLNGACSAVTIEGSIGKIKPEVRNLAGYPAPPQGEMIAKLNQNENPYDLPLELKDEILDAMRSLEWTRYPIFDPPELRQKLSARFGLNPDQILLGNGSNQLIYLLGSAIVSPGDNVVVTPPTFSLFDLVGRIAYGRIVAVDQNPDFTLDEEKVLGAVAGAKLSFLCSPNNPTGQVIPISFLEKALKRAGGLVVWDEAYGEFWGETAVPLLAGHPNLLILKTFSKAFGLAGLRIGYMMGHPAMITELRKVNIPFNINLMSLLVAMKLLEHPDWTVEQVGKIIKERDRLSIAMKAVPGITVYPSATNFILMRTRDGCAVFNGLKALGILVRPTEPHPLLKDCLRVTVGTPDENEAFLAALRKVA
jgi:histidinol-phosphate aminotransferase